MGSSHPSVTLEVDIFHAYLQTRKQTWKDGVTCPDCGSLGHGEQSFIHVTQDSHVGHYAQGLMLCGHHPAILSDLSLNLYQC